MIMEYQKIINSLDNTQIQQTRFRTKTLVEINDDPYNTYSQLKFKTSMLKPSLCDYSDTYILASGTITIDGEGDDDAVKQADERNKKSISKNCSSFTDCISKINNTQIDHRKDLDVVMPMYNLIEYSDNYSKTSRSLWQCYKHDPNDDLSNSKSFNFKAKVTGKTPNNDNKKDF